MQKTFMMLKPDAFRTSKVEEIIKTLESNNLHIEKYNEVVVTMDVMKTLLDHYHEVIDRMEPSFNYVGKMFNTFYYHGPHTIMPMLIYYNGTEDIITYTRELVGATNPQDAQVDTIRGRLSDDNYEKAGKEDRLVNNLIHASDSQDSVERELLIWSKYL